MTAFAQARTLAARALDLLLPPRCYGCGEQTDAQGRLCASCWSGLAFITDPQCAACGWPFEYHVPGESLCGACHARAPKFRRARSALVYDDASRPLILAFKRGDRTEIARPLAALMRRAAAPLIEEAALIMPVPLHRRRLWGRRFNQSALLAGALGRQACTPVDVTSLTRRRATKSQGGLSRPERRRNVQGAFECRRRLGGAPVLLVDDVLTTGATAEACVRALKKAGAGWVDLITLARVVTPGQAPI